MQEHEARDAFPDLWEDDHVRTTYLRARDLRNTHRMQRQRNMMNAPFMGCPPLVISWLLALHAQSRVAYKEGAHAERSATG